MESYPRVDFEEVYDDLRCSKEGKEDYYILPKEELLKYEDDLYDPITPECNAMLTFVQKHVTDEPHLAKEYVSEMLFSIALAAAKKSKKVLRKVICLRDNHILFAISEQIFDFSLSTILQEVQTSSICKETVQSELNKLISLIFPIDKQKQMCYYNNTGYYPVKLHNEFK